MKTLNSAILIALLSAPSVWAQTDAQRTESQTLRDRLEAQVERLNFNVDQENTRIAQELSDMYGFKIQCDRGWAGIGGLSKGNCHMGLQTLGSALTGVNLGVDRARLNEVTIELADAGQWLFTIGDREVKVPYNTSAERMRDYIVEKLKDLYSTSIEELEMRNAELAKEIEQNYFIKVISAGNLQAAEYHDGLQRVRLAAQMIYGSATPSEEEAAKFGIDTIVVSNKYKGLYENQGELRVDINREERPGKIAMLLIHQIQAPEPRWHTYIPEVYDPKYTKLEIQQFRLDRQKVNELREKIAEVIPNQRVQCILDVDQPRSVNIHKCRKGLETLQRSFVEHGIPQQTASVDRIVIGDAILRNSFIENETSTLFLDSDASTRTMHKAVTNQ